MSKRFTLEQIKALYENENREILDCEVRERGKNKKKETYVKYRCLITDCRYENWIRMSSLKRGCGCKACVGQSMNGRNSIYFKRPDLIKYFINPNDANNYTVNSRRKIQLKCPECGTLKSKVIPMYNLSSRGFSCDYCSDNISVPEKFGIFLLKQLGVEFETQKVFNWGKDKRYDNYFIFNNRQFIIEVHGRQHYEEGCGFYKTLKEEQENDKLKYDLAIQNGIKPENYIVIDCRKSELEWLKENFTKQLGSIFDLSNIDWDKTWVDCQSSLVVKVWNMWNSGNNKYTANTLALELGMNRQTVTKYLKIGNAINKCEYKVKEEKQKGNSKAGKMSGKTVYQYTLSGEFIQKFESCSEVERQLNIAHSSISTCCSGKQKSSGGYIWTYESPDIFEYSKNRYQKLNKRKFVYQYSLNNIFLQKFESVTSAELQTNISNISRCCVNKRIKSAGGFKWSYSPPINGMYPD